MEEQETAAPSAPAPGGYVTRPGVVTFICITAFISLFLQGLVLVGFAIGQYEAGDEAYFLTVGISALLFGALSAIILGLWYAKRWARTAFVIVFPLLAILELLGTLSLVPMVRLVVLVIFCFLLYRPKASAYFRGETLPAIDVASGLDLGSREIVPCPSCGKEIYSTLPTCHHCGYDLKREAGGKGP